MVFQFVVDIMLMCHITERFGTLSVEPAIRSGLLEAQPNYANTLMVSLNCLRKSRLIQL